MQLAMQRTIKHQFAQQHPQQHQAVVNNCSLPSNSSYKVAYQTLAPHCRLRFLCTSDKNLTEFIGCHVYLQSLTRPGMNFTFVLIFLNIFVFTLSLHVH